MEMNFFSSLGLIYVKDLPICLAQPSKDQKLLQSPVKRRRTLTLKGNDEPIFNEHFSVTTRTLGKTHCKKCKIQIFQGELHLAVSRIQPSLVSKIRNWMHPDCFFESFTNDSFKSSPKSVNELHGYMWLTEDHQQCIIKLIERLKALKEKKYLEEHKDFDKYIINEKIDNPDNTLTQFKKIVNLLNKVQSKARMAILKEFFSKGSNGKQFQGDLFIWIKLLSQTRSYNIQNKQLIKYFCKLYGYNLKDITNRVKTEEIHIVFSQLLSEKNQVKQESTLTLRTVDKFLEGLSISSKEESQLYLIKRFIEKCSTSDLEILIKLIKNDLKIGFAIKWILEMFNVKAYEAYLKCSDLELVFEVYLKEVKFEFENTIKPMHSPKLIECKIEKLLEENYINTIAEMRPEGFIVKIHKENIKFDFYFGTEKILSPALNILIPRINEALPLATNFVIETQFVFIEGNFKKLIIYVTDIMYLNEENFQKLGFKERMEILQKHILCKDEMVQLPIWKTIKKSRDFLKSLNLASNKNLSLVLKNKNSLYDSKKAYWIKVTGIEQIQQPKNSSKYNDKNYINFSVVKQNNLKLELEKQKRRNSDSPDTLLNYNSKRNEEEEIFNVLQKYQTALKKSKKKRVKEKNLNSNFKEYKDELALINNKPNFEMDFDLICYENLEDYLDELDSIECKDFKKEIDFIYYENLKQYIEEFEEQLRKDYKKTFKTETEDFDLESEDFISKENKLKIKVESGLISLKNSQNQFKTDMEKSHQSLVKIEVYDETFNIMENNIYYRNGEFNLKKEEKSTHQNIIERKKNIFIRNNYTNIYATDEKKFIYCFYEPFQYFDTPLVFHFNQMMPLYSPKDCNRLDFALENILKAFYYFQKSRFSNLPTLSASSNKEETKFSLFQENSDHFNKILKSEKKIAILSKLLPLENTYEAFKTKFDEKNTLEGVGAIELQPPLCLDEYHPPKPKTFPNILKQSIKNIFGLNNRPNIFKAKFKLLLQLKKWFIKYFLGNFFNLNNQFKLLPKALKGTGMEAFIKKSGNCKSSNILMNSINKKNRFILPEEEPTSLYLQLCPNNFFSIDSIKDCSENQALSLTEETSLSVNGEVLAENEDICSPKIMFLSEDSDLQKILLDSIVCENKYLTFPKDNPTFTKNKSFSENFPLEEKSEHKNLHYQEDLSTSKESEEDKLKDKIISIIGKTTYVENEIIQENQTIFINDTENRSSSFLLDTSASNHLNAENFKTKKFPLSENSLKKYNEILCTCNKKLTTKENKITKRKPNNERRGKKRKHNVIDKNSSKNFSAGNNLPSNVLDKKRKYCHGLRFPLDKIALESELSFKLELLPKPDNHKPFLNTEVIEETDFSDDEDTFTFEDIQYVEYLVYNDRFRLSRYNFDGNI